MLLFVPALKCYHLILPTHSQPHAFLFFSVFFLLFVFLLLILLTSPRSWWHGRFKCPRLERLRHSPRSRFPMAALHCRLPSRWCCDCWSRSGGGGLLMAFAYGPGFGFLNSSWNNSTYQYKHMYTSSSSIMYSFIDIVNSNLAIFADIFKSPTLPSPLRTWFKKLPFCSVFCCLWFSRFYWPAGDLVAEWVGAFTDIRGFLTSYKPPISQSVMCDGVDDFGQILESISLISVMVWTTLARY